MLCCADLVALCLFWSTRPNHASSPSLRGGSKIVEVTADDLMRNSRRSVNEVELLIVGNSSGVVLMEWAEQVMAALKNKWNVAAKAAPAVSVFSISLLGKLPKVADESADDGFVQWDSLTLPNVGLFFFGSLKSWFRIAEGSGCGAEPDNPPFSPELIAAWATRRSLVSPVGDAGELTSFEREQEVSVIAFGLDTDMNSIARDAFAGVMRNVHDRAVSLVGFAKAASGLLPLLVNNSHQERTFAIVLSNNRFQPPKKYEFDSYDVENVYFAMLNWVLEHSDPPLLPARRCTEAKWNKGNLIDQNAATSDEMQRPPQQVVAFVFPHIDSPRPQSLPWFQPLERLSSGLQDAGWMIVFVDNEDKKTASSLQQTFGLADTDLPCVRLELQRFAKPGEYGRKPSNLRFHCDFGDPINNPAETIETCKRAYDGGGLQPYFKSEPVPDYFSGPVQDIVGATFDRIVLEPGQDVVILFCTPWCGYCKKFEPTFRELASKMQGMRPWVLFGKMDFTRNDNRVFDFWTSPQLHIFQAYYKDDPVYYDIHRDQSEKPLEHWVLSHTRRKPPRTWHQEPENHSEEDGLLSNDPQIGTPGEL